MTAKTPATRRTFAWSKVNLGIIDCCIQALQGLDRVQSFLKGYLAIRKESLSAIEDLGCRLQGRADGDMMDISSFD